MEVDIHELIQRRRLQILVHSCLYYRLNTNIISDTTFDKWSKELYQLQIDYPEIAVQVTYHEAFKEFDGSSGYDLPYHDLDIQTKARRLLIAQSKR